MTREESERGSEIGAFPRTGQDRQLRLHGPRRAQARLEAGHTPILWLGTPAWITTRTRRQQQLSRAIPPATSLLSPPPRGPREPAASQRIWDSKPENFGRQLQARQFYYTHTVQRWPVLNSLPCIFQLYRGWHQKAINYFDFKAFVQFINREQVWRLLKTIK